MLNVNWFAVPEKLKVTFSLKDVLISTWVTLIVLAMYTAIPRKWLMPTFVEYKVYPSKCSSLSWRGYLQCLEFISVIAMICGAVASVLRNVCSSLNLLVIESMLV
jgi:hypothetical protein